MVPSSEIFPELLDDDLSGLKDGFRGSHTPARLGWISPVSAALVHTWKRNTLPRAHKSGARVREEERTANRVGGESSRRRPTGIERDDENHGIKEIKM